MQKLEELRDEIAEDVKNLLNSNLVGHNNCQIVQDNITAYLMGVCARFGWLISPTVKVENQGPFVTVNFFDLEGNRLETIADVLEYMNEL